MSITCWLMSQFVIQMNEWMQCESESSSMLQYYLSVHDDHSWQCYILNNECSCIQLLISDQIWVTLCNYETVTWLKYQWKNCHELWTYIVWNCWIYTVQWYLFGQLLTCSWWYEGLLRWSILLQNKHDKHCWTIDALNWGWKMRLNDVYLLIQ
jgi:hypothetical protein